MDTRGQRSSRTPRADKRAVAVGYTSAGDALVQGLSAFVPHATTEAAEWIVSHGGFADPQVVESTLAG